MPSQSRAPAPRTKNAVAPGLPLILFAKAPNISAPRIGSGETAIAVSTPRRSSMPTTAATQWNTCFSLDRFAVGRGSPDPALSPTAGLPASEFRSLTDIAIAPAHHRYAVVLN